MWTLSCKQTLCLHFELLDFKNDEHSKYQTPIRLGMPVNEYELEFIGSERCEWCEICYKQNRCAEQVLSHL